MPVSAISFLRCALRSTSAVSEGRNRRDRAGRRRPARSFPTCLSVRSAAPRNRWCRQLQAPRPSPSMIADVPGVVGDLLETLGPVMAAPGEDLDRLVGEVDLYPVA